MQTYLIDKLFEKYSNYSVSLTFFDKYEMENKETEESKALYKNFILSLNDRGYFVLMSKGNIDEANNILIEEEANYIEKNEYIIELKKKSSLGYYELRNLDHLSIVEEFNAFSSLTSSEELMFKNVYSDELDYLLKNYNRPELARESLFNKICIIFLVFSTIMTIIKKSQTYDLRDQNVDEYYLNNFLVSHGFLYYNNISYDKKRAFLRHIMEFHNTKGSLANINNILNILFPRDFNVYEYYLFYDEDEFDYYFLKVKHNESFIEVFNNRRNERQASFESIVSSDPSWTASKDDLLENGIKFIKSKYISIDSESDICEASKEVTFLINKCKRYRDLFGSEFTFSFDLFPQNVGIVDFIMFLTLMSMRVNGYEIDDIKLIKANEKMDNFINIPIGWEGNELDNKNKTEKEIITDSVLELQTVNNYLSNMCDIKKGKIFQTNNMTLIDTYRSIKKKLNTSYMAVYRPAVLDSSNISTYTYLTAKYSFMDSFLSEKDSSLLESNFVNMLDSLEKILILYGQSTIRFKDIYSNLYLPAIMEIINFFKSMNAKLFELSNSLLIESDNRQDMIGDDYSVVGTVKISNRDKTEGSSSGNPDYEPDTDFQDKEKLKDEEIDLLSNLEISSEPIKGDLFGSESIQDVDKISTYKDTIVETYPILSKAKKNLLYTSFSKYMPLITKYTEIFDTEERLTKILEDEDKFYFNGNVIDFFGNEGSYKDIREKYGMTYFEFRDKIKSILLSYNSIYGSVSNKLGIDRNDYLFNRNERIPFIKKPLLFRRVDNKVSEGDYLYKKLFDRNTYTDVVHIFTWSRIENKFVYEPSYTDKYRSTVRRESPKYEDINKDKYNGKRRFRSFINEIIERKNNQIYENDFIGLPDIPDSSF